MQDEVIKAVTGVRNIPPHHAEAMIAAEAYRQADSRSCQRTGPLPYLHTLSWQPSRE